jgi:hypothetical protein
VGTLESRKIDARNSGLGHPVAAMLQQNGSDVYDRNIKKEYEEIPSGFSRWSFNFNLTARLDFRDTIRLQPMELQLQPNSATWPRYHRASAI